MTSYCAFPNVQTAATAVHRFHKDACAPVELTARPYNRFEPLNTTWWLVPSTEWPAHRFGKLIFSNWADPDGRPMLFAGLSVEKGFGPVVAAVDRRMQPLVMKTGWQWPGVLDDLSAGALDSAVARVAGQTGLPVFVGVAASYYQDIEPGDPYGQRAQVDRLTFHASGADLGLVAQQLGVDLLGSLTSTRTLSQLGRALLAVQNQAWAWIDLSFGISLELVPLLPPSTIGGLPSSAWNEAHIWDRALSAWLPWVR
jgi:hypothetical protein